MEADRPTSRLPQDMRPMSDDEKVRLNQVVQVYTCLDPSMIIVRVLIQGRSVSFRKVP